MTFEAHLKQATRPSARASEPRERHEVAAVEIGLNAAILAVRMDEPVVLVVRSHEGDQAESLPFGPFSPLEHRTLEIGLRSWVAEQTGLELGYVEQLYPCGVRGRRAQPGDTGPHVVSIGYLALTRPGPGGDSDRWEWRSWYDYFPWED